VRCVVVNNAVVIRDVSCFYAGAAALKNVSLEIPKNCIYAFIGPSGCGKTTLLRSLNRMNDFIASFRLTGSVEIDGKDIYADNSSRYVEGLRKKIGMIFQQPNPLPTSILKNMILPLKENYKCGRNYYHEKAVEKLKLASLYEEVEDRLKKAATVLSGGQQQRLCIARALMLEPEIILFDEPCSALDPISTYKIEELLRELKKRYTIVMVTHNMEQATRISDYTAFFYQGEVVESGTTVDIFSAPRQVLTQNYLTGRF
jgi:phosphate transport system ATP-binding protein